MCWRGFKQIKDLSTGGITISPLTYGEGDVQGVDAVRIQQVQNAAIVELGSFRCRTSYRPRRNSGSWKVEIYEGGFPREPPLVIAGMAGLFARSRVSRAVPSGSRPSSSPSRIRARGYQGGIEAAAHPQNGSIPLEVDELLPGCGRPRPTTTPTAASGRPLDPVPSPLRCAKRTSSRARQPRSLSC